MFPSSGAPGGAFKGPAQMGQFTHGHASQMAIQAASRRNIAQTLGGIRSLAKPPSAPVPSQQSAPGMAVAPPPPGGNFKAHIAHAVTTQTGRPVTMNSVHGAIDRLQTKGAFTPFQASALKQHNGPLVGPQGQQTMGTIANEVATNG